MFYWHNGLFRKRWLKHFQLRFSYHQREYLFWWFMMILCIVALTAWIFEHFLASIMVCGEISGRFSAVIKNFNNRKQCVLVSSDFIILIALILWCWSSLARYKVVMIVKIFILVIFIKMQTKNNTVYFTLITIIKGSFL